MKRVYSIMFISACIFGFVSCSDDDDNGSGVSYPSLRDRTYAGDNLTVYIGDEIVNGVTATVKSEFKDAGNSGVIEDEDGNTTLLFDASYDLTIVLTNFPASSNKTTLQTVLYQYSDFSGTIRLNETSYKYVGEFTNGPLDPPEEQGCIIRFTVE